MGGYVPDVLAVSLLSLSKHRGGGLCTQQDVLLPVSLSI